jgi:hypothetical protein
VRKFGKVIAVSGAFLLALTLAPMSAYASSSAGTKEYSIAGGAGHVNTFTSGTVTTWDIYWEACDVAAVLVECKVGHGTVKEMGFEDSYTICDDAADGIGPYIDRSSGGSYGTSGNGHCTTDIVVPSNWRVRWDGATTPYFTIP